MGKTNHKLLVRGMKVRTPSGQEFTVGHVDEFSAHVTGIKVTTETDADGNTTTKKQVIKTFISPYAEVEVL